MFWVTTIADALRVPPHHLSGVAGSTAVALHAEIDRLYINRVLPNVGLVLCRYSNVVKHKKTVGSKSKKRHEEENAGIEEFTSSNEAALVKEEEEDCLVYVRHGVCVPGDGGAHHDCAFKLVVFCPFVNEVCVGRILNSSPQGIQVIFGFFEDIYIPADWMLRPSHYEEATKMWVWTPKYDDDEGEAVGSEMNRFPMEVGVEIRFKVMSLHFTQVTNTAKGLQATTTTTLQPDAVPRLGSTGSTSTSSISGTEPRRERSSSWSLGPASSSTMPARMHIVGSICEDGLGVVHWWSSDGTDKKDS